MSTTAFGREEVVSAAITVEIDDEDDDDVEEDSVITVNVLTAKGDIAAGVVLEAEFEIEIEAVSGHVDKLHGSTVQQPVNPFVPHT